MTDRVPSDQIEEIVGVERHPTDHYGRAVSTEQTVYILHSQQCKDSTPDLRNCPFSRALDLGINHPLSATAWRRVLDQPVKLEIFPSFGLLMPDFKTYQAAARANNV